MRKKQKLALEDKQITRTLTAEERRVKVAELYLQNHRYYEICEKLTVSYDTVKKDVEIIRNEWLEKRNDKYDAWMMREIEKIDLVEKQAWEEWHRSKLDAETRITEAEADDEEMGKLAPKKATVKKQGQTADPRYMDIILKCSDQRAKLLGLYINRQIIEAKVEHSTKDAKEMTDDELRARIMEKLISGGARVSEEVTIEGSSN